MAAIARAGVMRSICRLAGSISSVEAALHGPFLVAFRSVFLRHTATIKARQTKRRLVSELSIIGLMSGTSADGIDAAVLITDGVRLPKAICGHLIIGRTRVRRYRLAADPAMFLADATARTNLDTPLLLITRPLLSAMPNLVIVLI